MTVEVFFQVKML